MEGDAPTVNLMDEAGRSLLCFVEQSLEVEGQEYLLLLPVDSPIEIFAWEMDDDEEEEALVDLSDEEIDEVFDTAKAVLAEQELSLKRTAYTLTATGDLPEVDEDGIITLDMGEEEQMDAEQFQHLSTFFYKEQEYDICTPLDPLMFFARVNGKGEAQLLTPEEFQAVRSQLEEQLFDVME